jgi:hypothetical protein
MAIALGHQLATSRLPAARVLSAVQREDARNEKRLATIAREPAVVGRASL